MPRPSLDRLGHWLNPQENDDENEFVEEFGDAEAEACLVDDEKKPLDISPASLPVYMTIHRVRRLVLTSIDDPYTLEHFRDPRMNALIVRPLVDRLYDAKDISTVYCLLANRVAFLRDQSKTVHQSVNVARAILCELVASRILRRFHEDNPGPRGLLLLAHILVEGFDPFQGAPPDVVREGRRAQWPIQERKGHERKLTALELAIISESKTFISSSACQRAVDAVHDGQIVYTPLSFLDILPDHYKHRPISLYDPRKAPLLNHHRLIVPRNRNVIELLHFVALLTLYILTMMNRHKEATHWEFMFAIYTAGWLLEKLAAIIEHGWEVHAQNLWSFLDITFASIYTVYLIARLYDFLAGQIYDGFGLPILCIAAPVMLTRVAFNLMPNNIVFISLHAMMKDFTVLTFLGGWLFTGFLLALQWLIKSDSETRNEDLNWQTVGKWMLWIWFGLDGTGIEESVRFHTYLGPALMIGFAFLGNTLFLTILVAMLTNTFSKIISDETAEIQFRRAVLTFEGVKSDSIFAYPPPFNIIALLTLLPLKLLVSARVFHIINVFLIRTLNFPTLLLISCIERHRLWVESSGKSLLKWQFTGFSPHGDIQAVFQSTPPFDISDTIEALDPLSEVPILEDDLMPATSGDMPRSQLRRSRLLKRQEEIKQHAPTREVIWEENEPRG